MEKNQEIQQQINDLEDRIRQAPAWTPLKEIYEMFVELDKLKDQQRDLKTGQTDRQARIEEELEQLQAELDQATAEAKAAVQQRIDRLMCELDTFNEHYIPQGGNPDVNE